MKYSTKSTFVILKKLTKKSHIKVVVSIGTGIGAVPCLKSTRETKQIGTTNNALVSIMNIY
jgi:tRNA1(Val) A37 N6-methylase TrmN6